MTKRLFDIAGAAVALVMLAPILLVVAIAVKIDSPGPVMFRQQRVGLHGRLFRIHKFRTMREGVSGPQITVGDDPRITRLGRWLRSARIDEIPQLIDVLQGTMSLVGPRPEVPRYVAHYPPDLRERVLAVRPGITDPVSLAYADEGALLAAAADPEREYVEVLLPRKLEAAAAYAETATLWTDVRVLARSARVFLRRG